MEKMKAAFFYGKEDIQVHEVNIPKIKEDEILIKIRVCGICGSDVRSYYKGVEGRYKIPVILGHEVSGEVFKTGGEIDGFAIGDRVVVAPIYGCGKCSFCVSGQENLCKDVMVFGCNLDGAFAEYMKIPAQAIQRGALVIRPWCSKNSRSRLIVAPLTLKASINSSTVILPFRVIKSRI